MKEMSNPYGAIIVLLLCIAVVAFTLARINKNKDDN